MSEKDLIEAVADGKNRQKDIAFWYAELLKEHLVSSRPFNWSVVNMAIKTRWSMTGLRRIKEQAWKIAEGRI